AHLDEAYQKLLKRHKKASKNWHNDELTLHEREEYYHDMRKAAKKLRYAAEAAGAATKLKTKGLYAACKKMQSVLGDFQDSVTSRDKLLHLAQAARRRGEDTFGYGMLYQRERAIGLEALEDYEACIKDIKQAFKPLKNRWKSSFRYFFQDGVSPQSSSSSSSLSAALLRAAAILSAERASDSES